MQWLVRSIPHPNHLSSIPIAFPLSFQYHSIYWTNPLSLLWRYDRCINNTPWESRSLFISTRALNVYLRYPERSVIAIRCLSLSAMCRWRIRVRFSEIPLRRATQLPFSHSSEWKTSRHGDPLSPSDLNELHQLALESHSTELSCVDVIRMFFRLSALQEIVAAEADWEVQVCSLRLRLMATLQHHHFGQQ